MQRYITCLLCSILYVVLATHAAVIVDLVIVYTAVAFVPAAIVYMIYFIIRLVADEADHQWTYILFKMGCH